MPDVRTAPTCLVEYINYLDIMRFRALLTLIVTILLVSAYSSASASEVEPVEREHFVFHFDTPGYIDLADSVLNSTRERLVALLRDSIAYKPDIYLVNDPHRFSELVGGYFPDWGAAAAAPPRKLIAIKSPDHFNLHKSLSELLAHEYSHLALADRTGLFRPPRWFDEGLAMMISSEWSWSDNLAMNQASIFGQFPTLSEIDSVNVFNRGQAHVAYAESYLAVNYLFDAYGADAVNLFLDAIASGKTIDDALMVSTGSDFADFDREFRQTVLPRFNLVSLFMDTVVFWAGLAVIVIIGAILKFRKRRQYYKKWDEYEQLHSTDFDYGDPDRPEEIDDEDEAWRQ